MEPHSALSLDTVLTSLKLAAETSFDQAHPIPAAANHSQVFLEHEKKHIFTQEWICIGREDEITNHGDYLTHEIAGVPVLAIRQRNGSIAGFINACAHRFACLMPEKKGSAKKLICRYHAWTYDTSGQLIGAPYMSMKKGFDVSQHRLKSIVVESWEGFIYVTLAQKPETQLSEVLQPFTDNIVGRYDMAAYRTVLRERMVWNANWKNLIENFTESYHVPIAHGKTFAQHKKSLEDYVCGEDSHYYCYHRATQPDETGPGAAHPANRKLTGEWRRMMVDFCIFPCHLVTLMPDYLWYITVQPLETGKMLATWGVAVPPEILNDVKQENYTQWLSDFKSYMDIANDEDKVLIEALHIGSRSPFLPKGTYHPIERNLWQFNNYLAKTCLKCQP